MLNGRKKFEKQQLSRRLRPPGRAGPTRRQVAIIGAGRLGTALGRALSGAGYDIKMVVAKSGANARKAARFIRGNALAVASAQLSTLGADQFQVMNRCNLILIATPDDLI